MVMSRPPAALPPKTADLHDKVDRQTKAIERTNNLLQKMVDKEINVTVQAPQPTVPATPRRPQKRANGLEVAAVRMLCEICKMTENRSAEQVIADVYPGEENTFKRKMLKAAVEGGSTTNATYGAQLGSTEVEQFFFEQREVSVVAQLAGLGVPLSFGGANSIVVPMRNNAARGKLAGVWKIEGGSIPVAQDLYGSRTFNRNYKAIITLFSNELKAVSKVDLLNLLIRHIREDTAESLDTDAFDPLLAPIALIRPASLSYGAANSASAGADVTGIVKDLKLLRNKMLGAVKPVLVMHSDRKTGLELALNDQGVFIFREEVGTKGTIFGLPILHSPYVPLDKVFILDAAQFMVAADPMEVDSSSAATLVMANADGVAPLMMNPGGITTAGSIHVSDAAGTTPPTEVINAFQANSTALRMVLPITWGMVTDRIYYLTGVAW